MSTVREKCVSSDYNSLFLPENQGVYWRQSYTDFNQDLFFRDDPG
jgi:hypothetical protein